MGIYYLDSNYWGTTIQNEIRKHTLDYFEDPRRPVFEPRNNLNKPPSECHGVVWKVLINGQNPLDAITPVVVSGKVKIDVYFNRPMDISVPPFVTFGVRSPYTQNVVGDSVSWSVDSTVWTGYCLTTLKTGDGENTVRVAFARDTDHFEIPIENERFKFVVQVAGAASVEFMAMPGVGKVYLEWQKDDSLNTIGYNIYRYRMLSDTTFTDTVKINSNLTIDTVYTDYNVIPGLKYYYLYTIMGTDFIETDYSKSVNSTPLGSPNGDANGDLVVNVLDITAVIAYILNQNPHPFLFDAADLNSDSTINVLDVIDIIDVILGKKKSVSSAIRSNPDPAYIYLDQQKIRFRSTGQVSALQFELMGQNLKDIQLTCKQKGFEFATGIVKGKLVGILYNLNNTPLPEGMVDLISIEGNRSKLSWGEVTAGDVEAQYVLVLKDALESYLSAKENELQAFPNPFNETVSITYRLKGSSSIKLSVFDLSGVLVTVLEEQEKPAGSHAYKWDGKSESGEILPSGIYICKLEGTTSNKERIQSEVKIIIAK
jgi:hypothetical protein